MTIVSAVLARAIATPDRVAVRCGDRVRTFAGLAHDVDVVGRAWAARRPDLPASTAQRATSTNARRVTAIELTDPVDILVAMLAAELSGTTPLVCDPAWSESHRAEVLAPIGPAVRVTELPATRERVGSGRDHVVPLPRTPQRSTWATFTSGSAGRPRAVERTGASWAGSYAAVSELTGITAGTTVLVPGPLTSSLYAFAALHALSSGATVLLTPGGTARGLRRWLRHADAAHLVPHDVAALLDDIAAGAPSRLRTAVVGGAALPPATRARAAQAGITVVAYYGAAELSFVAVDADGAGLRPFPGVEIDVRTAPGASVGSVWVRSPWIATGYLGGASGPLRRDDSGWVSVGDLAEPDRPLRLRGRGDGAVITGGATVVPEDVEAVLRSVPGVLDVVVVGTPHHRLGAVVTAVVETGGTEMPRAALDAAARAGLSAAQRPRRWIPVDRLPRTPAGKPARALVHASVTEQGTERGTDQGTEQGMERGDGALAQAGTRP